MNPAQEFTYNLLRKKIEYYKFMAANLRNIEERVVYIELLRSYQDTLEKYLKAINKTDTIVL